jgi:SAM-dependent methyltransferase
MRAAPERPICDYEGSAYRTEFWGAGRDYEDAAERAALRHLLPPTGHRLIDIGGGYGRLAPLYKGYDQVVIFDYALSQLRQAQELWGAHAHGHSHGHRPRYTYVAGDFYHLPFAAGTFDTVTMVRTLHHAADAPSVIQGTAEILAPGGTLVLEFANKRNLKAMLRYVAGRQAWSPWDREPVEFVELNFDFHPAWVEERLREAGLQVRERRAVSTFRLGLLKRLVPTAVLVALDRLCQPLGGLAPVSPSVFVRCEAAGHKPRADEGAFFRCTACGSTTLAEREDALVCQSCDASFPIQNGIYDFRDTRSRTADDGTALTTP